MHTQESEIYAGKQTTPSQETFPLVGMTWLQDFSRPRGQFQLAGLEFGAERALVTPSAVT